MTTFSHHFFLELDPQPDHVAFTESGVAPGGLPTASAPGQFAEIFRVFFAQRFLNSLFDNQGRGGFMWKAPKR